VSGLRCRPGDLCVVIATPHEAPVEGLLGAFVTVAAADGHCEHCGCFMWRLEKPVDCVIFVAGNWHEVFVTAIADDALQPIRGQHQPEATPTAVDTPQPVEA
jgi:hypothetical protein